MSSPPPPSPSSAPPLPYDAIIVGTNLSSAILSAALSLSGAKVLHLDAASHYGGADATLPPTRFLDSLNLTSPHPPPAAALDRRPRPVLAAGALVALLAATSAGHYLSFLPLGATYLRFPTSLQPVPVSRAAVFTSTFLSHPEKRLLMRFLSSLAPPERGASPTSPQSLSPPPSPPPPDETFDEAITAARLTPTLATLLRNGVLFTSAPLTSAAARLGLATYLASARAYATPTPFLVPAYGAADLCEAFCRVAAVNGATFMLRSPVVAAAGDSVVVAGETLAAKRLFVPGEARRTWRFVAVLETTALGEARAMAVFPEGVCGNAVDVRVLQVDDRVGGCGEGRFVAYAENVGGGARDDLMAVVRTLFDVGEGAVDGAAASPLPKPLWSVVYQDGGGEVEAWGGHNLPETVTVMRQTEGEIDAHEAIAEARRCFCLTGRSPEQFFAAKPTPVEAHVGEDPVKDDQP